MPQPREWPRPRRRSWGLAARGFGVFGAAAALLVAGNTAAAQTLTEALAYAYQNNPQLLAQRASLRATDEEVPVALSGWRPTVNITSQAGYNRSGLTATNVPGGNPISTYQSFASRQVQLQASQPIYSGGRTEAATRRAINTVQAARAQTFSVETDVFTSVVTAFLDVVRDQNLLEVARNNEQVLRKQLEATRDRFRVGEVTRTDVAQAESSLAQAIAQRITAEGTLETSRSRYTRVVGHPPERLVMPSERPALPATRDEALALASTNNFNVISASFTEAAARDNVDVVRSQLLPQVSIVGSIGRVVAPSINQSGATTDTGAVVAQMTVPLYEGGSVYAQTRQAQQTVGQRRSQVDDARRVAVQNAAGAWETLQAARASIASFVTAVRAAQIALQGTQQEALVGSRTVLDVLIAEQQLFTTQSQLVTAQHDAALGEYTLTAAIGRLVAPALKLPVELYDMEHHYKLVKDKWFGFGGGLKE
ncbi:MAG: TolC family outer membrane protein [Alphaproteobacteria bacterium]